MKPNIEDMLEALIEREGGYVNRPDDRGGETKYGITKATLEAYLKRNRHITKVSVKKLTRKLAKDIYRENYFFKPKIDQIKDVCLQELMFDCCVLHGSRTAIRWVQKVVGAKVDGFLGPKTAANINHDTETRDVGLEVSKLRVKFLANITVRDPSQLKFLRGWINRALEFM